MFIEASLVTALGFFKRLQTISLDYYINFKQSCAYIRTICSQAVYFAFKLGFILQQAGILKYHLLFDVICGKIKNTAFIFLIFIKA